MNFWSAAELEPDQRAEMIANLEDAIADCNNALRLEAGYQAAATLWIQRDDPYVRAYQIRNNTPANGEITPSSFPEYDELVIRCKNLMHTSVRVDHVRHLLAIGKAEYRAPHPEAVPAWAVSSIEIPAGASQRGPRSPRFVRSMASADPSRSTSVRGLNLSTPSESPAES